MRIAVLLTLLSLLTACSNRVVSDSPWFSKESEANTPRLKSGLWVAIRPPALREKNCRFDERKPLETWPNCVSGYVVRDGKVLELDWVQWTERGRTVRTYDWDSTAHVLSAGDPRIDQVEGAQNCKRSFRLSRMDPASPWTPTVIAMTRSGQLALTTRGRLWPPFHGRCFAALGHPRSNLTEPAGL